MLSGIIRNYAHIVLYIAAAVFLLTGSNLFATLFFLTAITIHSIKIHVQTTENRHAVNPNVAAAGQKQPDYQRENERHKWQIAPIALRIVVYAPAILIFAFRRHLSAPGAITLLGFIALIMVATFYFAVRADFRRNEAIRAGCVECFDERVEYLIKQLRFSQEAALAAALQVADSKEPPRWMTALFGQSRTFRSLPRYHLVHSAAFGSFLWPAALVSLGSPLRKSIMQFRLPYNRRMVHQKLATNDPKIAEYQCETERHKRQITQMKKELNKRSS